MTAAGTGDVTAGTGDDAAATTGDVGGGVRDADDVDAVLFFRWICISCWRRCCSSVEGFLRTASSLVVAADGDVASASS